MNAQKLATICALLAAMSNLIGCESSRSSRSPDAQFQKQVMRAQECRQLQDKLVGGEPLTPERGEEIAETLYRAGFSEPFKKSPQSEVKQLCADFRPSSAASKINAPASGRTLPPQPWCHSGSLPAQCRQAGAAPVH
jgi:hypothetical protein